MKILMFGWEFPPSISGGLGTACHGLTLGMSQLGSEIAFVLPRIDDPSEGKHLELIGANQVPIPKEPITETHSVFRTIEIPSPLRPYETPESYRAAWEERVTAVHEAPAEDEPRGLLEMGGDYSSDLFGEVHRYAIIGERLGKLESHDVVHAHDWMTFPAGIAAADASGKPLVVHVHATEFDRSGEHVNQGIYDIERLGVQRADRVIAVSERTRRTLIDRYGADPEKVRVVHNAVTKDKRVERNDIERPLKEKVVLFLGRVTMQKGPDYFVEAAAKVLERVRNVRFVMAGSGDMLPRMIERAAALRITNHFHFTGFLKGEEVDRMFAQSDLYVFPSVSEPFGITPFEAIKHDVPVILSKQTGVAETLPNAVQVDFWDIDCLVDAIVELLTEQDKAQLLVQQHRRDLESVDWSRAAERVLEVYGEVTKS
ncbi:MAG: glycosyltransferase family 4 protein [Polyangiaceae bacterium]